MNWTGLKRHADAWFLVLCLAISSTTSYLLGQDTSWDLQNYHFYNPWAFVHGRLMWDLAPAQLQSFFNPVPDLPFYLMVQANLPAPVIAMLLALPAGISAWLLGKVLLLLFADAPSPQRFLYVGLAWVVGLSASHSVAMLGTTSNDWLGVPLILAALWMVLRWMHASEATRNPVLAAGLLTGLAAGLKLTNAPFAVGLAVALLFRRPVRGREMGQVLAFGLAVLAGFAVPTVYWASVMWRQFDNPLFPFFNHLFHSPWWLENSIAVRAFGPHSLVEWLTFPFRYLITEGMYLSEADFADWRFPFLYVLGIALLLRWIWRRLRRSTPAPVFFQVATNAAMWKFVAFFWLVSFLIWTVQHSIERYIILLELLSGGALVMCVRLLAPARFRPLAALVLSVVVLVPTVYPAFGRATFSAKWFNVQIPEVEPHALVLLHADAPMSFVLPYFPPTARFVGVQSNLMDRRLEDQLKPTKLYQLMHQVVSDHQGPIYALTSPPGKGREALAAYRVHELEDSCQIVETRKMAIAPIELCRVARGEGIPKIFDLQVKAWGPLDGQVGAIPNLQPDGAMGIWIQVETTRNLGEAQLFIGDQPAKSTTLNGDSIVAAFRPELLGQPGDKPVKLKQLSTGKEFPVGTFIYRAAN